MLHSNQIIGGPAWAENERYDVTGKPDTPGLPNVTQFRVGAAIFGVLWVIIISDLAKGTGRFNLLQDAVQAALGVGAFLSNFLAGFVVKSLGHNAGFLGLAGIASIGLVFFGLFMPETKHQNIRAVATASPTTAPARQRFTPPVITLESIGVIRIRSADHSGPVRPNPRMVGRVFCYIQSAEAQI